MKVRIGNDIRLRLHLSLGANADPINMQSAKAFLVNSTLLDEIDKLFKNKNRFIGRFPIEPFLNEFKPTAYAINSTGYPVYHAIVTNQYNGFGPIPDWNKSLPHREMPITEYRAEVLRTQDVDVVEIIFPAEAQLYAGKYKLIFTAQIYDPSYGGRVRTISIDKADVFEIVLTQAEADVDPISYDESEDIYVDAGMFSDNNIQLYRTDGGVVNVNVSEISGWHEGE